MFEIIVVLLLGCIFATNLLINFATEEILALLENLTEDADDPSGEDEVSDSSEEA